jgi:competence protein ComEC
MELRVVGQARLAQQGRHASFDFPGWLRRRGVAGELSLASVRSAGSARGGLAGAVDSARSRAERAIDSGLPARAAALERGMVLGEDERIDPLVRDDFRRSGLAHLLAVSGQNVMLLGALAFPLLAAAGVGLRARLAIVLALICVYVPLAGAGASIQRAGVMGAAGVLATAVGRPASRSYALLLAAVVTLGLNPRVTGDPGWQLSFAAVAGIAWLAPPIAQGLGRLPRPLAEGVAMSAAATLATAPLMAHDFGRLPVAGLAANLVALPAVAPIMWLGMLQIALGQAVVAGPPLSDLASRAAGALGALERPLLGFLEGVARFFSDLPWATVSVPLGSTVAMIAAYAGLVVFALACRSGASRAEPRAREAAAAWRRHPRATRRAVIALAVAATVLLASLATAPPPAPGNLTVRFLDVGQGDAVLIQDPHGAAVLFDGGPPEARVARLLRQAGVTRLSLVVATHQSRDHQGGLHEVIDRFPVDLLLENGDGTRDPDFHLLLAEADRRRIRRTPARAGQVLRAGELTVRILAPAPRAPGPPPGDPNERAVVAIVSEGGFDLFLSADAESPSILPLRLPRVEAMKVPHHGSADPGLRQVVARLRPRVAGIEVGAHNAYGHPRPSTIAALRAAVPHVYRTDRDGTVTLTVDRGGMRVVTGKGG